MKKHTITALIIIAVLVLAWGIWFKGWFGIVKQTTSTTGTTGTTGKARRSGDPCITANGQSGVWVNYTNSQGITYGGCVGSTTAGA